MQGVGLPDLETIKSETTKKRLSRSPSRSTTPLKNKSLDISKISKTGGAGDADASGDTSKTEVLNKSHISKVTASGIKEEKKDPEAET